MVGGGVPNVVEGGAGVVVSGSDTDRRFGLDAGLVKLLPDASETTTANGHPRFCSRLEMFRKACESRSEKAVTEGCLALLDSLEGSNWDAMEAVDLSTFDKSDGSQICFDVFDAMYRFDPVQEVPTRIEELTLNSRRQKSRNLTCVLHAARHVGVAPYERRMRLSRSLLWLRHALPKLHTRMADTDGALPSKGSYACEGERAPLPDVWSGQRGACKGFE